MTGSDYVSPACAGMIPAGALERLQEKREPRMRGDDPFLQAAQYFLLQ